MVDAPPQGPEWLHEIKYDGYRMHARLHRGRAERLTRTGLDWTHKYPVIAAALSALPARQAYLDGAKRNLGDIETGPSEPAAFHGKFRQSKTAATKSLECACARS